MSTIVQATLYKLDYTITFEIAIIIIIIKLCSPDHASHILQRLDDDHTVQKLYDHHIV